MEKQQTAHRRGIQSFVLRSGRMTQAQHKAIDSYWSQWGVDLEAGLIDVDQVFGRRAPLVLEIGFGMGASLCQMAKAAPEHDFIGIEVHRPGVGKLLQLMSEHNVDNIRVFCADAIQVLNHCIADNSLDRVQIYFPDPWHKKRHHKRRLIQAEFVELLVRKLKPGAILHLATDWENYAEQMMEVLTAADELHNQCGEHCFAERPDYRPETKFERRGKGLGHGVWDLLFEKALT